MLSRVWLFVTPRTVARQTPLSMRFSRQEYWSGLPETLAAHPGPGQAPSKPSEARPLAPWSLQPTSAAPFLCHHTGLGRPQRTPLTRPASSFQAQLWRRAPPHTLQAPCMVRAYPHSACGAPSQGPGLTGGVQEVPRVLGDRVRALRPPEPRGSLSCSGPNHPRCPAPLRPPA